LPKNLLAWLTVNFAAGTQLRAPDAAYTAKEVCCCADGYCTIRKWSGGLSEESWAVSAASKQKTSLKLCSYIPGPTNFLPRYRFWLGSFVNSQPYLRCRGWAWGGGLDPPKTTCCSTSSHTTPQGPQTFLVPSKVFIGSYVDLQPCGGLVGPGEACVKFGGKE